MSPARSAIAAVCLVAVAMAVPTAHAGSLYAGAGPRPGPAILYAPLAVAPQLQNARHSVWRARPILISGTYAYRRGEFLYQGFLYDDHGAHEQLDPNDPRGSRARTFSQPNGTYTYPTSPAYANNAADLVEFRVKPLRRATAFRVTLNTMHDPTLIAFTLALGGAPGVTRPFPFGANVVAPASAFLTVHPNRSRQAAGRDSSASAVTGRRLGRRSIRGARRPPPPPDRGQGSARRLEPEAGAGADGARGRAVGQGARALPAAGRLGHRDLAGRRRDRGQSRPPSSMSRSGCTSRCPTPRADERSGHRAEPGVVARRRSGPGACLGRHLLRWR